VNDGQGQEKVDKAGCTYWLYRLVPRDANTSAWEPPRYSLAHGRGELADPDTLHKVYSQLLKHLPLSRPHVQALEARGLKDGFQEAGYRTLGKDRAKAVYALVQDGLEALLPRVPGFFVQEKPNGSRYWTVAGGSGLLIPIRDPQGRIVALIVRADPGSDGPKYRYLSSKNRGGPGPGSPVHVPLHQCDTATVRITEGVLKADIATRLSGILTIGLPGVAAWHRAAGVLQALGAITARLALDADAETNRVVAQSLSGLARSMRESGFAVELERWNIADGKGIDDLLAGGKVPELLVGAPALAAIEECVQAAGGAAPAPRPQLPGDKLGDQPHEGPDDPHRLARLFLSPRQKDNCQTQHYWREEHWRWDGAAYGQIPDNELKAEVCQTVKAEFDLLNIEEIRRWGQGGDPAEKGNPVPVPTARKVTARILADTIQAMAGLTLLPHKIEQPCWLSGPAPFPVDEIVAAKNCLVHLPSVGKGTGCTHPLTPRFFSANSLEYDFNPRAPAPGEWQRFLAKLWPHDQEAIRTLQEWFGYCLLPDTSQQKILMVVGPKRSGKGTIARVLTRLVGISNACAPTMASLASNFGMQPLLGKTLAIISDARLSGRTDAAVVVERLLSISGEDAQTIDRKNLPHVTCKLPVRFVVLTNELPRLNDPSGALVSRLIVLGLTESWYGKEDTKLTAGLLAELPGILLWAAEGLLRLRDRGYFVQPEAGKKLIGELEDLTSPIGAFLRECCEVGPAYEVYIRDLFERWKRWCEEKGRKDHGNEQTFGRDLRAALPTIDVQQPRVGGQRIRKYVGIKERFEDPIPP
jgi:putative DNA primase/helicase